MKLEIRHIQDFLQKEIEACHKSQSALFKYKLDSLLEAGEVYIGTARHLESKLYIEIIASRSRNPRSNYNYSIIQFKNKTARYFREIKKLDHFSTNGKISPVLGKKNWFKVDCFDPFELKANQELWIMPSEPFVEMYHELNRVISSIDFSAQRILPNLSGKTIRNIPKLEESSINSFSKLPNCTLIIGPPGCGKSHTIAKIANDAIKVGKRVLVCAFTNEALISLCGNEIFSKLVINRKVKKYALTEREAKKIRGLGSPEKYLIPEGSIYLSTLCKLSQIWRTLKGKIDLVIMDEASQTILPMFELVLRLEAKTLFVGDPMQLPPVIQHHQKSIYTNTITFGFDVLIKAGNFKAARYIMPTTYRLSRRATSYTSLFYTIDLTAKQSISYPNPLLEGINEDGPVLVRTTKDQALNAVQLILDALFQSVKRTTLSCCLLTNTAKTTQDLQHHFATTYPNLFIDTVYRSQGYTFDFTIFYMPECNKRDVNDKLFNVATSRARRYTFIIISMPIRYGSSSSKAGRYLKRLEREDDYITDFSMIEKSSNDLHRNKSIKSTENKKNSSKVGNNLQPLKYTLKKRNEDE